MSEWLHESGLYGDFKRVHGYTIPCRHTRAVRWAMLPSQCPALRIRPARIPARSPHQLALAAGAARKVESGCEVRPAPAVTGFTWLVHGSHGCSAFCVGAGWRAGSYTRLFPERYYRRLYPRVTMLTAHTLQSRRVIPRRRTCGIVLRGLVASMLEVPRCTCQRSEHLFLLVVGLAVLALSA